MDTQTALAALPPYLLGVLASLRGQSAEVVDAVFQLIAVEERPVLEDLGIIQPPPTREGRHLVAVTPFGRQVIAACPDLTLPEGF